MEIVYFGRYPQHGRRPHSLTFFFFFNDTATTEIYTFPYTTLFRSSVLRRGVGADRGGRGRGGLRGRGDRKSTRLNSSHRCISYAVFCLTKQKSSFFDLLLSTNTQENEATVDSINDN